MAQYAKNEYLMSKARAKGMSEADSVKETMKPRMKMPKGMVSMKRSKKEMKAETPTNASISEDQFPYGLGLHLDGDTMEKLGGKMPAAGGVVHIHAKARVKSSEVRDEGKGKRTSAHLQITHMKLSHASDAENAKEDAAEPGEE